MSNMELYYIGLCAVFMAGLFLIHMVERDPVLIFGFLLILMFGVLILAGVPWIFIALAWLFNIITFWIWENIWLTIFLLACSFFMWRRFFVDKSEIDI